MNTILERINSTGSAFVEFSWPMLLQVSVLVVILLLADLLLRSKVRAVFRYWLWMLVLVKLVLPSTLSSPLSVGSFFGEELKSLDVVTSAKVTESPEVVRLSEPFEMPGQIRPVGPESVAPKATADVGTEPAAAAATWQGIVFLVWLAVVAGMGLLLLQRAIFVKGLVAQAKDANTIMNDALEFCRRRMGLKNSVRLKVSANTASPAVCGLFRPVILVPQDLAPTLGAGHLRAVLMHELAHIKRGDLWVNLAQTLLQIIYFYNPFVWLGNAIIRRVREQAVDEATLVAMGEAAERYPQTLLSVAKLALGRPALSLRLIGVVESRSALAGRVKRILSRPFPKTAKLGILGLVAVIIVGAVLLPMAKAEIKNIDAITKMEGLVGYWSFDGNANDKLGKRHGIVHEVTLAEGISGQGYHFGGGDDYISLGNMSLKKFSLSAWVKTEKSEINNHRIFLLDDGENYYAFQGNSGGGVGTYITGEIEINEYDKILAKDEWTHLVVTFDGKTVKIYWNGELSETGQADFTEEITGKAYIGFSGFITGDNRHDRDYCWNGMIDEVALFTRALTDQEVKVLYSSTRSSSEDNKFKATLSNGVTVELVGVCEHPSEGKQWWQPDGSLLEERPYAKSSKRGHSTAKVDFREFAVRVSNLPRGKVQYRWEIHPSRLRQHFKKVQGKKMVDLWTILEYFEENTKTAVVKVGVSAGKWQTLVTSVGTGGFHTGRDGDEFHFGHPYLEQPGTIKHTYITVTDTMPDYPHRVITIDKVGVIHEPVDAGGGTSGKTRQFTFGFRNIIPGDIKEFQFQIRPYEWVEFKNVSLKPNFKTDVQIEVEKSVVEVEKSTSEKSTSIEKHYQKVTFEKSMSIRDALRALGEMYKKNIIPSDKVDGQVPVSELYDVTFEEVLKAILGTHKYIVDGKFIRVYTAEEYKAIRSNLKTDVQVEGQELSFGPVVECVVYDKADAGDYLVDFDRLKLLSLPADFDWNSEKAREWVEENGVDAGGATQQEVRGLIGWDMIVYPMKNTYWEKAEAKILFGEEAWKLSKAGSPVYLTARSGLPQTYMFRTREGGIGILQILGFVEGPSGVKIRYKMVNKPAVQAGGKEP